MNKEIKEKVEEKRMEIKNESLRLRAEAKKIHKCPNCGKDVPAKRLYCSDECSLEFTRKYDYSQDSQILREYKQSLLESKKAVNNEKSPWSTPVSRKIYTCTFCGLDIQKGEKYYKYTRLPGIDEWFDDSPYEVLHYHLNCMNFLNMLVNEGVLSEEGFCDGEIISLFYAIAIETGETLENATKNISSGRFPYNDTLDRIEEYDLDRTYICIIQPDPIYKYVYGVRYKSDSEIVAELFISEHEIANPNNMFSNFLIEERLGDDFNGIISIKSLKIKRNKISEVKK